VGDDGVRLRGRGAVLRLLSCDPRRVVSDASEWWGLEAAQVHRDGMRWGSRTLPASASKMCPSIWEQVLEIGGSEAWGHTSKTTAETGSVSRVQS
jgi:hypothetical protein